MKTPVGMLLEKKGHEVVTIQKGATVYKAISRMVENNVGSIVVCDDREKIYGMFTERDYLRRIILKGRSSKTTPIEEVMTDDIIWVDPHNTIEECMAIMTEKKCRHLPVLNEGELVGIISIGDCVKRIADDAKAEIRYLKDYITGKYPA